MDPILSTLTLAQHKLVESSLANDEASSDEELRSFYVKHGLTTEQADQALRYRVLFNLFMFFEGQSPIVKGYDTPVFSNGSLITLRTHVMSLRGDELQEMRKYLAVLDAQTSAAALLPWDQP